MRKAALNGIYELAKLDSNILFIGSDLSADVLSEMKEKYPKQFFMEGVSEQHIIGMAAGLAMDGFLPYVNTIATFLTRRCYEQVAIDVCQQNLPVRLIANGGGGVYAPLGATHLALEDFSLMRHLPNMTVIAPCDANEMQHVIKASHNWPHPLYIRLAKGGDLRVSEYGAGRNFEIGKLVVMREPVDGLFITTGVTTQVALEAARLILESHSLQIGVIHCHTVKPLDRGLVETWIPKVGISIVVEEHVRFGGLGSAVLELCNDLRPNLCNRIRRLGIPDKFCDKYGSQNDLFRYWGLTPENLVNQMLLNLER